MGCAFKMSSISVARCPEYQPWYQIYAKVQPFYLMIKYANYLIIIFIYITENIRNERKLRIFQLPLITNFRTWYLIKA